MNTASPSVKAYSRIIIPMGSLLVLWGLAQGIGAESLLQVSQTGTASKAEAQTTNDGITLEKGKSLERKIAGGQTDSYLLTLTQGQYVRVVVQQQSVDVAIAFYGLDGNKLVSVDNPSRGQGTKSISFIAAASGSYKLEVYLLKKENTAGQYEIKIVELRTATEQDQNRIMAERAYQQGQSLGAEEKPKSFSRAIEKYQEALRLYREVGDQREEAA